MFPKPKTKRGEIGLQILNASMLVLAVIFALLITLYPLAPHSEADLDILYLLIILVIVLPAFLSIETILAFIRRAVFIRKNDCKNNISARIIRILYAVCFILAIIMLTYAVAFFIDQINSDLYIDRKPWFSAISYASLLVGLPITFLGLPAIFIVEAVSKKRAKAEGVEFSDNDFCIYKKPLFYVATILALLGALCIPYKYNPDMYNHYPQDPYCLYQRADSHLFSYIKVVDSKTREKVAGKLVVFPFNLEDTDVIISGEDWEYPYEFDVHISYRHYGNDYVSFHHEYLSYFNKFEFFSKDSRRYDFETKEWYDDIGDGAISAFVGDTEQNIPVCHAKDDSLRLHISEALTVEKISVYDKDGNLVKSDDVDYSKLYDLGVGEWYVCVTASYRGGFIYQEQDYEQMYGDFLCKLIIE